MFTTPPFFSLVLVSIEKREAVCKSHTTHNSSIRSDEGLTLETSASESLCADQFTLSTQLITRNYLNLPPLFICCLSLRLLTSCLSFLYSTDFRPGAVYKPHTAPAIPQSLPTEGLTLETSASESLYGGQLTLPTQLIKPNYHHRKGLITF